jgi:spermidine synthase
MGDDLAALAGALRGLSLFGFAGLVSGWLIVTIVAVLPASLIAGFQFPLLIALLGQGRLGVGGQVANAYVANMAGGIAGSLVGGFGLLPLVSAPTTWLLCGFSLLLLAAWVFTTSSSRRLTPLVACLAVALLGALPGPTAAWRHSGLGVGRSDIESQKTRGQYLEWRQGHRRALLWEADGVESSVALRTGGGVAFVVNGKVDGHATRDSPTQVMLALVGAAFHPNPRRVMVIGLGTGSTAGWLAAIPQVEVVDVSELEPRILDVAAALRDVNEGVLTNPRVRTHVGDAREFLQTVPGEYDLIVSEPSNPYRAGIATLFSGEYYSSAIQRLAKGGLFIQWLQAYEVDQIAVEQVFATMRSRFPAVSVFRTHRDLVLIGSREPLRFGGALRRRLASEPFLRAMIVAWDVDSFAEFMARYIGGRKLVDHVADRARGLVTDDLNPLEFGFARSVGRTDAFRTGALLEESRALGDHDPAFEDEPLTPEERTLIQEAIAQLYEEPRWTAELDLEGQLRVQAVTLSKRGDVGGAGRIWRTGLRPRTMEQRLLAAEALADIGDARFPQVVATLPEFREADVAALWARAHFRRGAKQDALDAALSALSSIHVSPWADAPLFARFLQILSPIARANPGSSGRIGEALKRPFAGGALYEERISMWAQFAMDPSSGLDCREAFAYFDRAPPLTDAYRTLRTACDKISR